MSDSSSLHVDLVSNEPLAGNQHLLARVVADEAGLSIDAVGSNEEQIKRYVEHVLPDLDPTDDPEHFLHELSERVDATYVSASLLHRMDDCPFRDGAKVISLTADARQAVA